MTDHAHLKTLAEQATPGPWKYRQSGDGHISESASVLLPQDGPRVRYVHLYDGNNAEFIAAANPQAILTLLAALEQAQAALLDCYVLLPPDRVKIIRTPTTQAIDIALRDAEAAND